MDHGYIYIFLLLITGPRCVAQHLWSVQCPLCGVQYVLLAFNVVCIEQTRKGTNRSSRLGGSFEGLNSSHEIKVKVIPKAAALLSENICSPVSHCSYNILILAWASPNPKLYHSNSDPNHILHVDKAPNRLRIISFNAPLVFFRK